MCLVKMVHSLWLYMATFGWQMIVLLFAQPMANFSEIWRDSFVAMMVHFVPVHFCNLSYSFCVGNTTLWKRNTQPQLSAMADNFGCRLLSCYLLSLLLIFKKSEEAVLLASLYISLGFIFMIHNAVFVWEKRYCEKKCTATVICHGR